MTRRQTRHDLRRYIVHAGIEAAGDGIWLVGLRDYDLGYIELAQKTLQPLDNPFGPRLSPMS